MRRMFRLMVILLLIGGAAPPEATAEFVRAPLVQHFPANKPADKQETCWKIKWGYTGDCDGKPAGALYIDEAWFRRSPKEEFVKILADLRLAEIYVAYHAWGGAHRYYDLSSFPHFGPVCATPKDLGPHCVARGRLLDSYTLAEVHDDAPRWRDGSGKGSCGARTPDRGRRGQKLIMWTTFYAGNYRYLIEYNFRDDGSITCRLGATAHNIVGPMKDGGDGHLHTACWRFVPALGDDRSVSATIAHTRQSSVDAGASLLLEPVNKEAGIVWKPEEFTVLRLHSTKTTNPRGAGNYIGYDLLMERSGAVRTNGINEEFTRADVWVTREYEQDAPTPNLSYRDVHKFAANKETLGGVPIAVWHAAGVAHSSRNEDFGVDDDPDKGVALTMWSSFTLKPRNLFASTPLFTPTGP